MHTLKPQNRIVLTRYDSLDILSLQLHFSLGGFKLLLFHIFIGSSYGSRSSLGIQIFMLILPIKAKTFFFYIDHSNTQDFYILLKVNNFYIH